MPLISIFLPVSAYHKDNTPVFQKALKSISNQSFSDFQVLIINDGKNENDNLFREHAERDPRFVFFQFTRPVSPEICFKRAFYQSMDSAFFMRTSPHNIWQKDLLAEHLQALAAHPEAILSYSFCQLADLEGNERHQALGLNSGPYDDGLDLDHPEVVERILLLWEHLKYHTAVYGLCRMETIIKKRVSPQSFALNYPFTRPVLPLALAGFFVKVKKILYSVVSLEPGAYRLLTWERLKQLELSHKWEAAATQSIFSLSSFLRQGLALVLASGLEPEVKNKLLIKMPQVFLTKYSEELKTRELEPLLGNINIKFMVYYRRLAAGQADHVDRYWFVNAFAQVSYYKAFFPEMAGLDRAMALCRLALQQTGEAAALYRESLAKMKRALVKQEEMWSPDISETDLAAALISWPAL